MNAIAPVVVVGAGLMGAAAARSLAGRGVPVTVLEQFGAGHRFGSSHGSARIVRRVYGDPLYVRLTGRAFELWADLERAAGTALVRRLGGVDFGPGRDVPALAALLADAGVPHSVLPARTAEARWPGLRFAGEVLFHAQAGTVDADAAVTALLRLAAAAGADVRTDVPVRAVDPAGVSLADGTRVPARCVVVAAGGGVAPLLGGLEGLPSIRVTRQSVFHFPRRDVAAEPWPSVIHEAGGSAVYHLAGGRDGGPGDDRKIGLHDAGPVVPAAADPANGRDRAPAPVDAATREQVIDYVREWLPGLVPSPRAETTCLYTTTPTEDFVLDRIGDVVVCSPCSGHGAKFAPLVGEWVADLVLGTGASVPDRFRLAAHAAAGAGAVSL